MKTGFCVRASALASFALLAGCASSHLMTSGGSQRENAAISIPYSLPRGLIKISVARNEHDVLAVDVLDVVYEPDPAHQYYLTYDHSLFSTDTVSIQTTDTGLLEKISAQSKDQRGEVVKKLVELATETGKAFIGARGKTTDPYPTFSYETFFDPTLKEDRDRLIADLGEYGVEILELDATPLGSALSRGAAKDCNRGACFRLAIPYAFVIAYRNQPTIAFPDPTPARGTANILIPNGSPILAVEINRYAFVEAKTEIVFDDGMLTKISLDKPSEAVGFMEIPIDVAKSIVSIPSALFDFKIKSMNDDQRLNTAQMNLIESQMRLLEKQQDLLDAKDDAESGSK